MKPLILGLTLALTTLAQASDYPRTLPREYYLETARRGTNKNCYFWVAPGFDRSRGITWSGEVEWAAKERSVEFLKTLKQGLKDITTAHGAYSLKVAVVLVETDFWATGDARIEVEIRDEAGRIMALGSDWAMTAMGGANGQRALADSVVGSLEADLFK
ncbi:hypothetical protein [Geothrix sp. PMB-07]|uniref:hypothetical protein n=1 Tax=Geothrix sp. PMB-07 TaxID=3068640 RepID=UPI0027428DAF|nr:hypothetical protein [Geothrix sp. PMB-07]WLT30636.1 hypothetical protein Q9293_13020 [Geothrix sp. PMB-07]